MCSKHLHENWRSPCFHRCPSVCPSVHECLPSEDHTSTWSHSWFLTLFLQYRDMSVWILSFYTQLLAFGRWCWYFKQVQNLSKRIHPFGPLQCLVLSRGQRCLKPPKILKSINIFCQFQQMWGTLKTHAGFTPDTEAPWRGVRAESVHTRRVFSCNGRQALVLSCGYLEHLSVYVCVSQCLFVCVLFVCLLYFYLHKLLRNKNKIAFVFYCEKLFIFSKCTWFFRVLG